MTRVDDESHGYLAALRSGNDTDLDVRASRDRFDRAALAGRRRRRRKLGSLLTGTAVALIAVGAATLPRGGEPERLVVTDGVVAPPSSAPSTQPGVAGSPLGPSSDEFITVSGGPGAVIDVRNAVEVVASFDLPCAPDLECTVQSARVMGDTIWVAVTEARSGDADAVVRSRVVSASRSTGEMVEHLSLDGTAAVRSAGRGANGVLYAHLDDRGGTDRTLVAIDEGQTTVLETKVSGFRLSDDGRFLAVSFSDPPAGETARFEISNLVEQSTTGFDTLDVNAGPGAWSPDGRFLIVNEQWEDGTAWVVDPWSGSGSPVAGTDGILDGACFISDRVVAHRTWNVPYGEGDAQLGVIRLTSLDTGSTVAEFGDDIFGDAFHCHADGSISYLRRPVVEVERSAEFAQLQPDFEAPAELVHIATDGTISSRAVGDLRIV